MRPSLSIYPPVLFLKITSVRSNTWSKKDHNHMISILPQVKVRRSFPLTSIEKIEYDPDIKEPGPKVFKLLFSTYVMTLQAETREDAKDWVEKIENGRLGVR